MTGISLQWAREIRAQAKRLDEDEDHIHNNRMHADILKTWEVHSPKMWARLQKANLADPLAKVLQARMWDRKHDLMDAGYPMTDAREVAEREILMLEPEEEAGDRLPPEDSLPA